MERELMMMLMGIGNYRSDRSDEMIFDGNRGFFDGNR